MDQRNLALDLKHSGCNCCQAVIAAYAEELGIDLEQAKALGAAFGAGMGNMKGNCGALCGAQIVLGLMRYSGRPLSAEARNIYAEFENRCGGTVCADIKGVYTGNMLCTCDDCVANAVDILEKVLSQDNP